MLCDHHHQERGLRRLNLIITTIDHTSLHVTITTIINPTTTISKITWNELPARLIRVVLTKGASWFVGIKASLQ